MKKNMFNVICLLTLFVLLLLSARIVKAEYVGSTRCYMEDNGNFYFNTTDTVATTNITWETIGFTVRRDSCDDGNPRKDNKYAEFMLKSKQKIEGDTLPDGTKQVYFYLSKAQVNIALKDSPLKTIQDNDILYLSAIIKVHNGTKTKDTYYTLDSIKNAEGWKNPDDFADRFNREINYNAGNQEYPVTITYQLYQSGNYVTVQTSNQGNKKIMRNLKLNLLISKIVKRVVERLIIFIGYTIKICQVKQN